MTSQEKALRESEAKYRELADLLPQMIFELDRDFQIIYANQNAHKTLGFSGQDLKDGINALSFLEPSQHGKVREKVQGSKEGMPLGPQEYTAVKMDGSRFPVLIYSAPIFRNERLTGFRVSLSIYLNGKRWKMNSGRARRSSAHSWRMPMGSSFP
jgi:PAS domain S-box-containing protein